ncbi:transcriptional regulator with XRE-family HTH domain [Erwinia toletana]|uniref:Transcriptional regulator with XRE-family HTH domain n=1 Tax=Winslowiella toletana TaxID=92490 RepID=A0ABS4PEI5_9GAMM|nr:helix-turn-helix transcriptional regulator [Winslowiella toletana]MBP2170516.1 transcriptional regulator with XRE-family HTH domain [Winslowiella toletana]
MSKLNELIAKRSPASQARIQQKADAMILDVRLRQLREELALSQTELAGIMGISQPAIAAIEARGEEIKLSSLKKYIEALGGKLSLNVEMPTGSGRIYYI